MPKSHLFYDLCIADGDIETQTLLERVVNAQHLGYAGVGAPHQSGARLNPSDKCNIHIFSPDEIKQDRRTISASHKVDGEDNQRRTVGKATNLLQLKRLNFPVDDVTIAQDNLQLASIVNEYDLVVAQPKNEKAFVFACTSMKVDLISIDCSSRLNFRFKTDAVQTALRRGMHFEILYGSMLREQATRRQFISNVQSLVRECRGRQIVISSGARSVMDLRGPYDVINLGMFLGLSEHQARSALTSNPKNVIANARKRKAFRECLSLRHLDEEKDGSLLISNVGSEVKSVDPNPKKHKVDH